MCLFHLQHVCSVISPRFQYLNLMFSICNLKRGIRCAAMCSDFFYILSYRQRMCVCYAVYSNLYLVILGFDDKFSQSSRFCWQSNFSSIFKCGTSQFYLVPDVKNKIDLSRIFQALSSNWVPLFGGGSFGGYTEGILFTSPRLEIISRSRWGIFWTTEEMTMSRDSWLKSIQLCPLSKNDELFLHSYPLYFSLIERKIIPILNNWYM